MGKRTDEGVLVTSEKRFDLQRFVDTQDPAIDRVRAELRGGEKRSHLMWFVFPQIAGLGHSAMAQRYAIGALSEARTHFEHPVLGPRLVECTELVLGHRDKNIGAIFGTPDDMKFHSSMTLFRKAAPGAAVFDEALRAFFGGRLDAMTIERLA